MTAINFSLQKQAFYIMLFLLPVFVYGQQLRRYTFTHFTSSAGLASNQVHTIAQDEKGYIWIGTTDGLQRYDGIRYKTFLSDETRPDGLPSNVVQQLLMDDKKNLWLLFGNGKVGIFNTRTLRFREMTVLPGNPHSLRSPVKRLVKDEYGHIFFLLAGNEVLTWDEDKSEFSPAHNFFSLEKEWGIADFVQQRGTKNYWISIQGVGLAVYNAATRQLSYAGNNTENIAAIDGFEKRKLKPFNFYFDKKGRVWFNTWGPGIPYTWCYDLSKKQMLLSEYSLMPDLKTYHEVRGFFEQADGTIWARGVKVLAKYIEAEKRFEQVYNGYENEKDIAFRVLTCMFEDRETNLWVGTGNNGMFRFNPNRELFTNVPHTHRMTGRPGEGSPLCFIREKTGNILVGHWGDGIYRYDSSLKTIPLNIKGIGENNLVAAWDMCASGDSNTIWIAAQPGLYRYDQRNRSAVYYHPRAIRDRTIREIAEDKKGNLWLGMQGIGVYKWDAAKGKTNFDDGIIKYTAIPEVQINCIEVDRAGLVWIATANEGAYAIDPETDSVVHHFHKGGEKEMKLPEEGVSAILDYNDSLVVITTTTRIFLYNRVLKQTLAIGNSSTLSGSISSLEKDRSGYVWISTLSALYRMNLYRKVLVRFDRNDGMTNDYFILSSSYALPDGRLLFGTSALFVAFNPEHLSMGLQDFPEVSVTDFRVMNKSLPVDSLMHLNRIVLGPGQNSIDIEFSYLRYINTFAIKYKLEGLDKNWKVADKDHRAIYSYLPPGTYRFQLATIDTEGNTSTRMTELVIRIKPPFWKTWWFFCLLTLLIAGIFYWLDTQRINRLMALQKVRTEIAGNLHEEVNTTLNNISLLSEMARIKAGKDPERSKEYISQISVKSQSMINSMDDILWSIDPENDSMEKSLLRMMEYADTLKNLHGVHIEIALDKKVKSLKLDMKTRHEVLLIFKQALRMIIEYSGGKNTLVHIDLFKGKLSMRLQDASARIDTGRAEVDDIINDLHSRATEAGADLDVQDDGSGVTILLLVAVR